VSHLGNFFRDRRIEKGLAFGQLARLLGYTNLSGGCNRIQAFERGGKVRPDLLGKLAEVLEVSPDQIRQHAAEDYKDWLAWASEPVRPHVVVRLLAAVYQRVELPDDALGPEAAEAVAAVVARERKLKVCLVLSRRVSIWFDTGGRESGRSEATPEMPCEPFLMVGGKRVQFDFGVGMLLRPIDGPGH
jgi:transcriptional regulator with XRE-family HTH domain